jgi:hypothetical protein
MSVTVCLSRRSIKEVRRAEHIAREGKMIKALWENLKRI